MNDDESVSGNLILPSEESLGFTQVMPHRPDAPDAPTYGETLKANFRQFNDVFRGAEGLSNSITRNPYQDEYEEGYDPRTLLDGVPEQYWGNVLLGKTREDGERIVGSVNQELADRDVRERSGWLANLTTTLGASFLSPTTLIPLSQTVKYATVAKSAFAAASYSAKVLGPTFALQNALLVGSKETGTVSEWVQDTITDTFFASAFGGALNAFSTKKTLGELDTAKAFFKAAEDDVDISLKMGPNGELTGEMVATPRGGQGDSAGAMRAEAIQAILDVGDVSFKNNKVIKKTLGWAQPIVEGLTSKFKTVREFTDDMFAHNFPVAHGDVSAIKDPGAESFIRNWRASISSLEIATKQEWLNSLGYKGPGKSANAFLGELQGKFVSYDEFKESIAIAYRRGGVSENAHVSRAAKYWKDELYTPLGDKIKQAFPTLNEHTFTNIDEWLNRVYHKGKIQERPDEFVAELVSFLEAGNAEINAIHAPGLRLKEQLEALKKTKPKSSKSPGYQSYKEKLMALEDKLSAQHRKVDGYIKSGKIQHLLDRNDKTKLRRVLLGEENTEHAIMWRDTILAENEEQIAGRIFESISSSGVPGSLHERTILWNDLAAEKWLVNDMETLGALYMDQMTKRIHTNEVFQKYGIDPADGMKGMVKELKSEYDIMRYDILDKPATPERAIELKKLEKEFKQNQEFMENAYSLQMGSYVNQSTKMARTANTVKQFTAGTLLGNMPMLQLTEFFTPMFKFMFSEYVMDGLVQTINRIKHVASQRVKEWGGENVGFIRGAFADSGLGNNMALNARMQSLFGYGNQYQPKTLLERYVNNLSKASSQVSLANMISDFQETAVAFTSQAKTIRQLKRWASGAQLTPEEIARFDVMRLNPEKYGNKILEMMKTHGEEIDGSFIANPHKWGFDKDGKFSREGFKASQIFRIATEKEVRSVITKPNLLDIPFGMRDPMMSVFTQFLSWNLAATLNFALPAATSMDKQKFVGILLMMASGALVDPLRQLAKGEEVNMNGDALAISAMSNSGFFGWPWDAMQRVNAAIDIPLLRPLQSDRFRRKNAAGLLFGPAVGVADSMLNVVSALANNEINQKDAQRAARLFVPFSGTWYLRQPVDSMIKSFNVPTTREKARRLKEAE